jgi:hypothetical protein
MNYSVECKTFCKAAIQKSLAPVQLLLGIQGTQELQPDPFPDSLALPFLETTMAGGRGSIPPEEATPLGTGAQHPEDAIDGFPVVGSRT